MNKPTQEEIERVDYIHSRLDAAARINAANDAQVGCLIGLVMGRELVFTAEEVNAWPARRDRAIALLLEQENNWQRFCGRESIPVTEATTELRARGLVMWRESAAFRAATTGFKGTESTAESQSAAAPDPYERCRYWEYGQGLVMLKSWQTGAPENVAARERNEAALSADKPAKRAPSKHDPRPGIDDVGGFSSVGWEE